MNGYEAIEKEEKKRNLSGCSVEVATILTSGKIAKCMAWDDGDSDNPVEFNCTDYIQENSYRYVGFTSNGRQGVYNCVGPLPEKKMVTVVKSKEDLLTLFLKEGYKTVTIIGTLLYKATDGDSPLYFDGVMFDYCGKEKPLAKWLWRDEWLEEIEVD